MTRRRALSTALNALLIAQTRLNFTANLYQQSGGTLPKFAKDNKQRELLRQASEVIEQMLLEMKGKTQ